MVKHWQQNDISDVPSKDQSSWRYRSTASTAAEYETIMF